MENHINCETAGKILEYRYLVKIYELVLNNSMCNEIGRLSQDWEEHAGTDTIYLIFHKDKPKDRVKNYVKEVCDIRSQKTETHRTRITTGGNLIYYPGEFSTPTSDLTTMKPHVNSTISDVKSRYMFMDVKYFYLNKQVYRVEYIMIHIFMIPQ